MVDPEYAVIQAIAGGDSAAFEFIVKRYQTPVCNFVYRYLGDRAASEDITQEVLLRVYQSASRFDPRGRVSSWVFQIARNLSLNEIKRRKRLRLDEAGMDNEREYVGVISSVASGAYDLEQEIVGALGELPENQRVALLLRVNEGLTYREIGEVLGVSVQSVESLIFRARERVRSFLRRK
jgi:RNA polymerase sigma-70 factor, ECF subfamily